MFSPSNLALKTDYAKDRMIPKSYKFERFRQIWPWFSALSFFSVNIGHTFKDSKQDLGDVLQFHLATKCVILDSYSPVNFRFRKN